VAGYRGNHHLPYPYGGSPLPYPPLYRVFWGGLKGGSIPRQKFFRKKSEKLNFILETEKKFPENFSKYLEYSKILINIASN
jgi:hypothetical protein